MKILILMISIGAWLNIAQAGNEIANGGDGIVCPSGHPFKIELLDFYEASVYNPNFSLDLGSNSVSLKEKIDYNLKKIEILSPVRAQKYKDQLNNFFDEVLWVRDTELIDLPDSEHLIIPTGCEVKQLAIQIEDDQIPGKKYIIDEDLWDQLNDNQKLGLIFHEVIYREAIDYDHENSIEVRKLNSWIASEAFQEVTKKEFDHHLINIGLPTYLIVPGYEQLFLDELHTDMSSPNKYRATVTNDSYIPIAGQMIKISKGARVGFQQIGGNLKIDYLFRPGSPFFLFPEGLSLRIDNLDLDLLPEEVLLWNGRFKFIEGTDIPKSILSHVTKRINNVQTAIGAIDIVFGRDNSDLGVYFHENGSLRFATLQNILPKQLSISQDTLLFEEIYFDKNGQLVGGRLNKAARFSTSQGLIEFSNFFLYPNDEVRSGWTEQRLEVTLNGKTLSATGNVKFDLDGTLIGGHFYPNEFITVNGVQLFLTNNWFSGAEFDLSKSELSLYQKFGVYEFKFGNHEAQCISNEEEPISVHTNNFTLASCSILKGSKIEILGNVYLYEGNSHVRFYSNGNLKRVGLDEGTILDNIEIRGKSRKAAWFIALYDSGEARSFVLNETDYFEKIDGSLILKQAGETVTFDKNGFLIKNS